MKNKENKSIQKRREKLLTLYIIEYVLTFLGISGIIFNINPIFCIILALIIILIGIVAIRLALPLINPVKFLHLLKDDN